MSDALQHGLTTPADVFLMPEDLAYGPLQARGFTRYPFDPNRVAQLMAEAG